MRPVCFGCRVEMKCDLNGIYVERFSGDEPMARASGDVWKCETCGTQIVTGFGAELSSAAKTYEDCMDGVRSKAKYYLAIGKRDDSKPTGDTK